jgi:hypothetical protein
VPRVDPVQVAWAAAVLALLTAVFTAPLVLGTYVVIQRAGERQARLWVGALVGLMLLVLLSAAAGLAILMTFA